MSEETTTNKRIQRKHMTYAVFTLNAIYVANSRPMPLFRPTKNLLLDT